MTAYIYVEGGGDSKELPVTQRNLPRSRSGEQEAGSFRCRLFPRVRYYTALPTYPDPELKRPWDSG